MKKFIFLIIFLLITCCAIVEFLILPRSIAPFSRQAFLLGFVAKPNSMVDDVYINSMGFTGDVLKVENKPEETIRILTLGSSSFFNRNLTVRLKDSLQKASKYQLEILGGALRTHTTRSSIYKYRALSKFYFDYVLIYNGINDLWANNLAVYDSFKEDYSHLGPWYRRNWLLEHSLLIRILYNNWFKLRRAAYIIIYTMKSNRLSSWPDLLKKFKANPEYFLLEERQKQKVINKANFASVYTFRKNLRTLIKEIKRDGGTPILMTFAINIPDQYSREAFLSNSLGYRNPDGYNNNPLENWGNPGYVKEGIRRHNKVIRELAEEYDVLLIDQERLLGREILWFSDPCHFSEEGTSEFINNVRDFFVKNNLLGRKNALTFPR